MLPISSPSPSILLLPLLPPTALQGSGMLPLLPEAAPPLPAAATVWLLASPTSPSTCGSLPPWPAARPADDVNIIQQHTRMRIGRRIQLPLAQQWLCRELGRPPLKVVGSWAAQTTAACIVGGNR